MPSPPALRQRYHETIDAQRIEFLGKQGATQLTNPGQPNPWVKLDFERHEWDYKTGLGIPEVLLAGSAQLEESEVGTQSLPEVPAVELVSIPPGSGDLQQLLDEYRARATNIARWQLL